MNNLQKIFKKEYLVWFLLTISALSYFNFGSFFGPRMGFIHYHDLATYYLGSKYFNETGQYDFYIAFLAAINEEQNYSSIKTIRDVRSREFIPVNQIQDKLQSIHNKFSSHRWQSFKTDCDFFRSHFNNESLEDFFLDYGYNPSPIWSMTGSFLTNSLSDLGFDTKTSVYLLASLDILLLSAMFLLIYWAFGFRAFAFSFIFWTTNPFNVFNYTSGSFLRYCWLFSTVASLCLFKREKYILSGSLMAYAIGTRLFPIAFILFAFVRFFDCLIRKKEFSVPLFKFGTSLAVTILILFLLTCKTMGGLSVWGDFSKNIQKHNEGIYSNHVSFRNIFLFEPTKTLSDFANVETFWSEDKEKRFKYYRPAINFLTAFLFMFFLYVFRNESVLKGMLFSSFLPFLFFYPANYYFGFLILLIIYLTDEPPRYLQGVFGLMITTSLVRTFIKQDDIYYTYLSYVVLLLFIWILSAKLASENSKNLLDYDRNR